MQKTILTTYGMMQEIISDIDKKEFYYFKLFQSTINEITFYFIRFVALWQTMTKLALLNLNMKKILSLEFAI